jgi:hypothetical protein
MRGVPATASHLHFWGLPDFHDFNPPTGAHCRRGFIGPYDRIAAAVILKLNVESFIISSSSRNRLLMR